LNLDYLAGFFDGEGCVHFYLSRCEQCAFGIRVRVTITVAQKDPTILNMVKDFLGFGAVYKDGKYYRFVINSSRNVYRFITLISERCILKKRELSLAKEVIELFPRSGTYMTRERLLMILRKIKLYREIVGRKQAHHYNLDKCIEFLETCDDVTKKVPLELELNRNFRKL
jgi:hypothetical protein